MRRVKVLIAGAGPCGLGAALEMLESGPGGADDFLLVDGASQPGGWASSRTTPEGFTFDFGGHVLFPHKHYQRFSELLRELPIGWASSVPQRGVQVGDRFLPYPAQRNLQRLPTGKLARAIASVAWHKAQQGDEAEAAVEGSAAGKPEGDLRTYLLGRFGSYLTKLLMGPLNRKQWAHGPEQLTDVWVRHRSGSSVRNVADTDLRRIVRNLLLGEDDPGWTPETRVTYPSAGGSGAIWSAVAAKLPSEKMMLRTRVVAVSLGEKTARLSTGEVIGWEQMISTMPLDTLLRMVGDRPDLGSKAEGLVKARSRLFGFGVRGELPERYRGLHSCQVTDKEVPFWRMNFPMTVSQGNGPEGCYSVLCEVSEPAAEPSRDTALLRDEVEASLRGMGLLGRGRTATVSRWEYTIEHGYPVPFLGRDGLLASIEPELEVAEVYSRGRFGTWRYEISNQDHAFMQGVEAVRRVLFRLPEETYGNAMAVNGVAVPALSPDPARVPSLEPLPLGAGTA